MAISQPTLEQEDNIYSGFTLMFCAFVCGKEAFYTACLLYWTIKLKSIQYVFKEHMPPF